MRVWHGARGVAPGGPGRRTGQWVGAGVALGGPGSGLSRHGNGRAQGGRAFQVVQGFRVVQRCGTGQPGHAD